MILKGQTIPEVAEEIHNLKQGYPEDLILAKHYMKSLLTFSQFEDEALLEFEQFELKPYLEKLREAQSELSKKHSSTKYESAIDFFELGLCNYYLSNDEFGRLTRKYLTSTAPAHLQIQARFCIISRLDNLSDIEAKERHFRRISELLKEGKYKQVAYGTQWLLYLILKRMDQAE